MKHGRRDALSLGPLCGRGHEFQSTGRSMRFASGHCYECLKLRRVARYRSDVDSFKSKDREYYSANRNQLLAARKRNYLANRDSINAKRKSRLDPQKERERHRRVKAAFRKTSKAREYARSYYRRNSIRIALRNRVYRALTAYGRGKRHSLLNYGIDLDAIIAHLGACPGKRSEWHIDHIRPLALFDLSDAEQVKTAFAPTNHQWLSAFDNISKGARYASR